jgi:hypothetical protein
MNDGQSTTHPEPDPAPFKVHLLTRAGRVMRARNEPVRAFSNKDEAVRFAGRQLGGHYAVYHKHKKVWPAPRNEKPSPARSPAAGAAHHFCDAS